MTFFDVNYPRDVVSYARLAVAAGAEWLDTEVPDWPERITKPIDVHDPKTCPLGQVFGDFLDAGLTAATGHNEGLPHAFAGWSVYNGAPTDSTPWDLLSELWTEATQGRLNHKEKK